MKPDLVLLTNLFPSVNSKSEMWLQNELNLTSDCYNKIYIIPNKYEANKLPVAQNCEVVDISNWPEVKLSLAEVLDSLLIVCSDFSSYQDKMVYLKTFRYNFSLIRQLHQKAKAIGRNDDLFKRTTIVYAYWADNLATTAAILIKEYIPGAKFVTRGHGFEIFEEQTLHNVIPFRKFQYKYLSKIFADSKKGMEHLNLQEQYLEYKNKNDVSYVGTIDHGNAPFNPEEFSIATCSIVRDIKRLHLMPRILQHIGFVITWHILGDGPALENLKSLNAHLPKNIKVRYHGLLENDRILEFYKNNSVNLFVSLSSSEGLPVSMMEAQSFGIPLMSTNVGGCNEICNEKTGFLIDKDFNPEEVVKKILAFKNSDKNTQQFRDNCREYWKTHFNAEVNYKKFAEEIVKL